MIQNPVKIEVLVSTLPPAFKAYLLHGFARWALPVQESGEMSIRTVVHRLMQNGRIILRSLRNNERFHSNRYTDKHFDKIHVVQAGKLSLSISIIKSTIKIKFEDNCTEYCI